MSPISFHFTFYYFHSVIFGPTEHAGNVGEFRALRQAALKVDSGFRLEILAFKVKFVCLCKGNSKSSRAALELDLISTRTLSLNIEFQNRNYLLHLHIDRYKNI